MCQIYDFLFLQTNPFKNESTLGQYGLYPKENVRFPQAPPEKNYFIEG